MRFFILFVFIVYYNMNPQNEHITDANTIERHSDHNSINEHQIDINNSIYKLILSIPIVVSFIITYIIEYVVTVIKIIYGPIHRQYNLLTNPVETTHPQIE
jgi:hypothetical protein